MISYKIRYGYTYINGTKCPMFAEYIYNKRVVTLAFEKQDHIEISNFEEDGIGWKDFGGNFQNFNEVHKIALCHFIWELKRRKSLEPHNL